MAHLNLDHGQSLLAYTIHVIEAEAPQPQGTSRPENWIAHAVAWVGARDGSWGTTWERFAALAIKIIGPCYVPDDLVVVGEGDWWLRLESHPDYECCAEESTWELEEKPELDASHRTLNAEMLDGIKVESFLYYNFRERRQQEQGER